MEKTATKRDLPLPEKPVQHSDNGATLYLLETAAPNTSTFAVGL